MKKGREDKPFRELSRVVLPHSRQAAPDPQVRESLEVVVRRLTQSALLLDGHRILESNPAAEFVLGRTRGELVGNPWTSIFARSQHEGVDSAVALRAMIERSMSGRNAVPRRWRFCRPDGSTIEWEISLSAVENGNDTLVVALIRDPSEWRQSDLPNGESFRWEQLGKLSWGIAHDFNNMLTAIDGGLDNAMAEDASERQRRQGLVLARTCVSRAARLNRRLLDLSRDQRFRPGPIDIDALLDETVRGLEPILSTGIEVVCEPNAEGLLVSGDREQLEQALVNLALNARDAMPDGGTLTLSTSEQVVDSEFLTCHPWAKRGRYVRIDVRDSGLGIPYDMQPRVFEPFFTSKADSDGIGLGLSIVYGVVKQHRGFIDLESTPGKGTRFWMMFPVRLPDSPPAVIEGSGTVPAVDGAGILVVDDEEVVLDLAVTALRGRGFRVLHASSAEEAEGVFSQDIGSVDVLVTDLMLGGLGGHELSLRFKARKPELRVVYTTGYDIGQLPTGVRPGPGAEFLQKPYTLRALAESVERLLREV